MGEHQDLKAQLEAMTLRANNAEAENKTLVDRWMLQKMQDAERLNEVLSNSHCLSFVCSPICGSFFNL